MAEGVRYTRAARSVAGRGHAPGDLKGRRASSDGGAAPKFRARASHVRASGRIVKTDEDRRSTPTSKFATDGFVRSL